jgi:hypothetical protein
VAWDNADHDTGHAEYYVAHTKRFEISNANWTDEEKIDTLDYRWWSLDALLASGELFEPAQLPGLIQNHRTVR